MATETMPIWSPSWRVAPGEVLTEALESRGITQAELARRMDRPLKTISEIATGKTAITADTAIQLERALGISAAFWSGLEAQYRLGQARERAEEELRGYSDWAKRFPLASLRKEGILRRGATPVETTADLLRFFEVASPAGWSHRWTDRQVALRASAAHMSSPEALSAWLRWGEIEAGRVETRPFDRARLIAAIPSVRSLTTMAIFEAAFASLVESLRGCGVAVVRLPSLDKAPVSGASYWLARDRAVIQLTLRHRTNDHFWFTVLHEIGHLVAGGRALRVESLEVTDDTAQDPDEVAANRFARDALFPPADMGAFIQAGDFSRRAITEFASRMGVHAGLVVGRLQRDDLIDQDVLNGMKVRY